MDVVRRTDVNRGDARIRRKLLKRGIRFFEAESLAGFFAAFFCAAENAAYRNSEAPQSVHMRPADKPHADDCHRMLHRPAPGVLERLGCARNVAQRSARAGLCS